MGVAQAALRNRRSLGLLLCLIGVAGISFCYFEIPLYARPEDDSTVTGWEWASGLIGNMLSHGVSPSFLFGIALALLPLAAAALMGVLGIARFAAASPHLAIPYLALCALGSTALAFTLVFVIFGLRLGALGEVAGYALCFWADYIWRGPHPARPPYGMS